MRGSSFFKIIRKEERLGITGPTGPTGSTGPTGPTGFGPTGPTGVGITFVGLSLGKLVTYFEDGTSYITSTVIKGPTGDTISPIGICFSGSGKNIVSSQPSSNSVLFRSIKGSTSTSGRSEIKITESGNILTFQYIPNSDGISLTNISPSFSNSFLGTTGSSGLSLTDIRDTKYNPNNGTSLFTVKNVFEKARGLGFTGATNDISGITCNYVYDGGTFDGYFRFDVARIDPSCKSKNNVDYMKTNKTFVVDMKNNYTRIEIGSPISGIHSTSFTLVVKNARNSPIGAANKFISSNPIYWPFGVEPCFSQNGTDVYHFYSLFDSWFGSVVYSTAYDGKTFDCPRYGPENNAFGACCEKDTRNFFKNVIQIAAGKNTSGVIRSNKLVTLWGQAVDAGVQFRQGFTAEKILITPNISNTVYAILGNSGATCAYPPGAGNQSFNKIPPTATDLVDIVSTIVCVVGLKANGTLVYWGSCPTIPSVSGIKKITAGANHITAITSSDGLTAWGSDTYGQLKVPTGISFTSISAYDFGTIGLAKGGTVYAWGRTGISAGMPSGFTASQIAGSGIGSTDENSRFLLARQSDGTMFVFGYTLSASNYHIIPSGYCGATDIIAGAEHALAVIGGEVVGWGANANGQLTFPPGDCGITCSIKLRSECNAANKTFRGEGTFCTSTVCEVTGPCCSNLTCGPGVPVNAFCSDGITFENCLCKTFQGSVAASTTVPHIGYGSCQEIDNCDATTCPDSGACCLPNGTCQDNYTPSSCSAAGGIYRDAQTCSVLGPGYCTRGRCGVVPLNNPGSGYSCSLTIQSDCPNGSDGTNYRNWSSNICANDPIIAGGACCTLSAGTTCSFRYEFKPSYENIFDFLTPTGKLQICGRGACGQFRGFGTSCVSQNCPNDSGGGSDPEGACIERIGCFPGCGSGCCVAGQGITIVRRSQCTPNQNRVFYEGLNGASMGRCCTKVVDNTSGFTWYYCNFVDLWSCYSAGSGVQIEWFCDGCGNANYYKNFNTTASCSPSYPYGCNITYFDGDGKESDNGMLLGDFYPLGENVDGRNFKTCCPPTISDLISGTEKISEKYETKFDWYGYGITFAKNNDDIAKNIKFKVFLYHRDLYYENDSKQEIKEVIWGQSNPNCAWGPHVTQSTDGNYSINDLRAHGEEYAYYKDEGFWQVKGISYSAEFIANKTFNKQASTAFTDSLGALIDNEDSIFSNNGAWRRNWGLYNTMRMIGADNAFYALNNPIDDVNYEISSEWTAPRLVDKLNQEVGVPPNSSSWFIPSLDEMAFICQKLTEMNVQVDVDMDGSYWTSTGTFDEKTQQGIRQKPITPVLTGSKAWSFRIGKDKGEYVFYTKKEDRSKKLKVRPIRVEFENIIALPAEGTEQHKLWRLEHLKWVREFLEGIAK